MFVVALSGGLGNQMFQYASVYAISRLNNASIVLDIGLFDFSDRSHVKYMLGSLGVSHHTIKFSSTLFSRLQGRLCKITGLKYVYIPSLRIFCKVLKEKQNLYQKSLFEGISSSVLVSSSNLQSYKYFDMIEVDYIFRSYDGCNVSGLSQLFTGKTVLSVHVRRGDYLDSDSNMVLLDQQYYLDAYEYLINQDVYIDYILFFTNDIDWVKRYILCCKSFENAIVVDERYPGESDDTYMRMMSKCDYHIISNSTFSWWGAYMSSSKLVIAPSLWFKLGEHCDLIPRNWKLIEVIQ